MIKELKQKLLLLDSETNQDYKLQQLKIIRSQINKIIKDSIQDKKKYLECKKIINLIDFSVN